MTVGSLFILLRAAFCVSANLTVNESIVGKKYPYLQTADRQFWNYFDRGMLANCLQFWLVGNPGPDWALIYQREQQVHHPAFSVLSSYLRCSRPAQLSCLYAGELRNLCTLLADLLRAMPTL